MNMTGNIFRVMTAGLLLSGIAFNGHSQDDPAGGLEDVQIEIVKERQITLPPANRNFEKIPPRPAETGRPSFSYDFKPFSFQAGQINPAIRPSTKKLCLPIRHTRQSPQSNPTRSHSSSYTPSARRKSPPAGILPRHHIHPGPC